MWLSNCKNGKFLWKTSENAQNPSAVSRPVNCRRSLRRHSPLSHHTGKSARNSTTPGKKDQGSSGGTLNFVFRLYVLQLDVDPCSRITNYFVHRRVISGDAPKFFYSALFFKERLVLFSKSGRFSNLCTSAKCPKNVNRQ